MGAWIETVAVGRAEMERKSGSSVGFAETNWSPFSWIKDTSVGIEPTVLFSSVPASELMSVV
jgi:hypothetical protein